MTEHPILFSGPMVRAIREGRKTQTRRVVKPQPNSGPDGRMVDLGGAWGLSDGCLSGEWPCPYGVPGDRLWVRETWAMLSGDNRVWYRADPGVEDCVAKSLIGWPGWQPSIFMPRENSRITLEVTGVRVERLQETSEADAKAEGAEIDALNDAARERFGRMKPWPEFHRPIFALLWDSINAERAPWASNPWVWVIEFKTAK